MDIGAGWLIALALVAVVGLAAVLAVISLARAARDDAPTTSGPAHGHGHGHGKPTSPANGGGRESLLRQRYSNGEIGLDEYRREMRALHTHN